MIKKIGFNIGSSQIGWAYLHVPNKKGEQFKIAAHGSRIIPLKIEEKSEFDSGKLISKNTLRTQMRGARRLIHRYKMRKEFLNKIFADLGLTPSDELFNLTAMELYALRNKAVSEKISPEEIGRLFYMLNQRRGYKSSRLTNGVEDADNIDKSKKTSSAKEEEKKYLDLINDREKLIKNENITIGQYFYRELLKNPLFRIKEEIFMRDSYKAEFDKIWEKQKSFYPKILNDANYDKIRNQIIYYHRPLKSKKHLVGGCTFENKFFKNKEGVLSSEPYKVAPKSSPLFQINKIWQELNNVRITDKEGNNIAVGIDVKKGLFNLLNERGSLSTAQVLDYLQLKPSKNYYVNIKKNLEGNRTIALLKKKFLQLEIYRDDLLKMELNYETIKKIDTKTGNKSSFIQVKADVIDQPLYRLWHLLYSVEDKSDVIKKLVCDFEFSEDHAEKLCEINFNNGYGNLSTKAIRKILPHLEQGQQYSIACEMAGYRHSDYLTKEENEQRTLKDRLELYEKNSLRNPVVEKVVNQIVNIMNAILVEEGLGRPDEIVVELSRELSKNTEDRRSIFLDNKSRNKKHLEIEGILQKELGLKRVSRNDIEKYKLWMEFDKRSPYEPNKEIGLKELFTADYTVEHIIPKCRLLNNSFSNKTIASRSLNSKKDTQTGFDFMKSKGSDSFNQYCEFINAYFTKKGGISKTKKDNLLMAGDKIPDDFVTQQLKDTQFIAVEVRTLLTQICRNVHSTCGIVTDYLKHIWGVNDVLKNLNINKYPASQIETYTNKNGDIVKKIKGWSKRDDHRNNAIDAIVIACTTQSHIKQLNELNKYHNELHDLKISGRKFDLPCDKFINIISDSAESILVSFKSGKKVATKSKNKIMRGNEIIKIQETLTPRGSLHKDTVYGKSVELTKVKLTTNFNNIDGVADQNIKRQLIELLAKFDNDPKKAFKKSKKNPLPLHLMEFNIYERIYVVRYPLEVKNKKIYFKADNVENIIDKAVREKIYERLNNYNNDSSLAFADLDKNPIWLNKEAGICIKSVRCKAKKASDLKSLHKNSKGEDIDFVATSNNHHFAIYKDERGVLRENVVTLWDAFKRKKSKLPVVVDNPKKIWDSVTKLNGSMDQSIRDGLPLKKWEYITSGQENEMFVFGIKRKELIDAVNKNNYKLISNHLYRVQKLSTKCYYFRHHLETSTDDAAKGGEMFAKKTKKLIVIQSLNKMKGIKVKISNLGRIVKIED